ncbi:MAG: ComF family protein, partial [bacterium]
IPMERWDFRRRGFNQAREIAARAAAYLGVPGPFDAVRKTARTAPQSRTSRRNRAGNVRGVFTASPSDIGGRHVLLVADLVTTGATAASCAAALYSAGARRVTVLCFGRAL